jgi:hypothetical protein
VETYKRDLTKSEYEMEKVYIQQLEDERPFRIMCDLASRHIRLFYAYEKLKQQKGKEK